MKTEKDYIAFQAELEAIENSDLRDSKGRRLYLADQCVDAENVTDDIGKRLPHDHPDFYDRCYGAACSAAGERAQEYGLDINKLLGRVVF